MAYIPPHERDSLVDDVLNRIFPDDTDLGAYPKMPISTKHTAGHFKSVPETPNSYSPIKDWHWRSGTAKTSPTSFSTSENTFIPSVKNLTCYFWLKHGKCKWTDEECLYAHYHTGKAASGPVQVEQGKPAVAGKNASNVHPIYLDWRAGLSQPNGKIVQPDIQQQIEFIKAKAHEQNLNIIKHQFDKNNNIMGIGVKPGQCELVNNYRVEHVMSHVSPMLSAPCKPAPTSPEFPSSSLYPAGGASQQPALRVRINADLPAEYASYSTPQPRTEQLSQPSRQMICPRPMDHLKPTGSSYELYQTVMTVAVKDRAIRQLAQALDTAIENMELQQQGAAKEVQTLLKLAKSQMANEGLGGDHIANEIGRGTYLHPYTTSNGFAPAHVSAHQALRSGNSQPRYPNSPDIASKVTGIGDNLMHMMQREKICIDHLNEVKENVGKIIEDLGEGAVLPKGWFSRKFSIR
ncbi:hypothetical protein N7G274_003278 [Stereocaulon virgatum]|uniref:C3H1-type domain-containing protein n=1 Tax=Stereocaulon virgatum TaxID=373712 RepID=A0ABR4AGD6_9LECA